MSTKARRTPKSRKNPKKPLAEHQPNTTMHNHGGGFFPKEGNGIKPPPSPSPRMIPLQLQKETSIMGGGCSEEDEFSNNELNMGFIADESKLMLSDSQSVVSEGLSISNISCIRGANTPLATPLQKLQEEFSGMEEWSMELDQPQPSLKRPSPWIGEEVMDEDLENRCSKKKMGDRFKIVTIKSNKHASERPSGYTLRSRSTKPIPEREASSDESLQEILEGMEPHDAESTAAKSKHREK